MTVPPAPTAATLRKYGMTAADWEAICRRQDCVCPVCGEPFGDRKLAIDHEHAWGFKAHRKLASGKRVRVVWHPDHRRAHVRGVLHAWCNRFVRKWLTLDRARRILAYLESHEESKRAVDRASESAR